MAEIEYEAVDFSGLTFSDNEKISTLKDRPNVGTPIGNGYSASDLKLRFDAAANFLLHYLNLVMRDDGKAIKIADVDGGDTTSGVKTLADLVASITSGGLAANLQTGIGKTLAQLANTALTDVDAKVEGSNLVIVPDAFASNTATPKSIPLSLLHKDLPLADYALEGTYETASGKLTLSIKNDKASLNKSIVIDLPTETYFKSVTYNNASQSLELTNDKGEVITVPVGALVSGLLSEDSAKTIYVAKADLPQEVSKQIKKEAVTKIAGFDGVTVEERAISRSVNLNVDGIEVEFDENNEAYSFNITSFLPIKPGSLHVDNSATGWEWEDDGNGNLIRDGEIAGTVDYETGKIGLSFITQGYTFVSFKPDATCIGLSTSINTILKRITDVENSISGVEEELTLLNEGGAV